MMFTSSDDTSRMNDQARRLFSTLRGMTIAQISVIGGACGTVSLRDSMRGSAIDLILPGNLDLAGSFSTT